MPVLTAIDVLGVQRFIFSSNRLRDVVAGSWLVHWSTSKHEALNGLVAEGNILLAAGGNAIIEFDSIERARKFTARYTRRLHDKAPGLEVVVAHKSFENGGLARALQEIQIELARMKTERMPSAPLLGISVTAVCQATGLPATGFNPGEPTVPLSTGVLKRRKEMDNARKRWSVFLDRHSGFAFPLELDDLGRTYGDTSLIGLVHIDGNGVGRKIKAWLLDKAGSGAKDSDVRREYRDWSEAIDELGVAAFQTVVNRVCQATEKGVEDGRESVRITGQPARLGFDLTKVDGGDWMLPLRPILLGGDDLTFVCDGRIALDLAETALSVFHNGNGVPHLGKVTASAGVAIVGAHAPIVRAYKLAENLCASAKSKEEAAIAHWIGTSGRAVRAKLWRASVKGNTEQAVVS